MGGAAGGGRMEKGEGCVSLVLSYNQASMEPEHTDTILLSFLNKRTNVVQENRKQVMSTVYEECKNTAGISKTIN